MAAAFLIIFLVLPVWPLSPACDRTGLPEYSGHRDAPPGFYRSDRERAAGIYGSLSADYAVLLDRFLSGRTGAIRIGNTVLTWGWAWVPGVSDEFYKAHMLAIRELVRRGRTEGDPFRKRMPENIRQGLDEAGSAETIYRKNCLLVRAHH